MKPITQQLKRFADDERAVSPVVGFVLIFALIMIVFTIYQAEVVPAQNADIEFEHSQTVEADMSQLNDAIRETGASGVPQSVTVATGVQYPNRAFAINPGAPAGTLETVDAPDVVLSGLSDGSGYWGGGRTFETQLISYRSNYNILQQETTYTLENGMFVKNFENGNDLLVSNGSMISSDGQRINLVLVGGEYTQSATTTSVTVRPMSTSTEYLYLNATGSNPSITIPTTLPQSSPDLRSWDDIVAENSYIVGMSYSERSGPNEVTLDLKPGHMYSIRLTKVTLGGSSSPALEYLTSEDARTNRTVAVGTPETFTVSARDAFGNPYSGATVTATTNGSGKLTPTGGMETNDEGRATFTYTPVDADAGTTVELEFSIKRGGEDDETVTYELAVSGADSSEDSGGIDNGYPIDIILEDVKTPTKNTVKLVFNNTRGETVTATKVRVNGMLRKGANAVLPAVAIEGTDITINGGLVSLDDPVSIPANRTASMTVTTAENFNKGGFLILYIVFDTPEGTVADTYFVGVSSK